MIVVYDRISEVTNCLKPMAGFVILTYWKLTLSTWNLVSKIPDVSTLHRSKSWYEKNKKQFNSCSNQ